MKFKITAEVCWIL